jgi:hypothetical protein
MFSYRKKCNCDGYTYYKVMDADDLGIGMAGEVFTFYEAVERTPPKCVLTPISSKEEYDQIAEIVDQANLSGGDDAWVGVYKDYADVVGINYATDDRCENWKNMDGSTLPDDPVLWNSPSPDNNVNVAETNVLMSGNSQLLFTSAPTTTSGDHIAAVFKCCIESRCPAADDNFPGYIDLC